jgi:MOSC domain-containing protein YiiM
MPREGIFVRVLEGGTLRAGDEIRTIEGDGTGATEAAEMGS